MNENMSMELMPTTAPEAVLRAAELVARSITSIVKKNNWEISIAGRPHLRVEAWETLAQMYKCAVRIVAGSTNQINVNGVHGWEAAAEVIHLPTGQIIGRGEGMCLSDEDNWSTRPKYETWAEAKDAGREERKFLGDVSVPSFALRSMAQTRAAAKALKLNFSWVIVMAGYQGTPAEEAIEGENGNGGDPPAGPIRKSEEGNGVEHPKAQQGRAKGTGKVISQPQVKRFFAIKIKGGWNDDQVKRLLAAYGLTSPDQISGKNQYEEICSILEKGNSQEYDQRPETEAVSSEESKGADPVAENPDADPPAETSSGEMTDGQFKIALNEMRGGNVAATDEALRKMGYIFPTKLPGTSVGRVNVLNGVRDALLAEKG